MHFKNILSLIAGVLFFVGFFPYIRAIVRKETQSAKASWIVWAMLDLITFSGMYAKHTLNGQMTGAVIGTWTVMILSVKYGKPGWNFLDKFCLGGAALSVVLWMVSGNPTLGIVTSLGAVFLGSIPTFVSAWHDPSKEDRTAWTIFFLSCIAAVIAIPAWTLGDAAQPITSFVIEGIMMYLLYARPRLFRGVAQRPIGYG